MKRSLPLLVLLLSAAGFAYGLFQLFKLRFDVGDIYPEYSSLRSDPLGTMALYESLERIPGLAVRRDFLAANQLPEGRRVTYLHLGRRASEWNRMPEELVKEIEDFLGRGGRLAIALAPQTSKPFRFPNPEEEEGQSEKASRKQSSKNGNKNAKSRERKARLPRL